MDSRGSKVDETKNIILFYGDLLPLKSYNNIMKLILCVLTGGRENFLSKF